MWKSGTLTLEVYTEILVSLEIAGILTYSTFHHHVSMYTCNLFSLLMEQFPFFLRLKTMLTQAHSHPFSKGVPQKQETAHAITTAQKQSMTSGWHLLPKRLCKVAICPTSLSMETNLGLFIFHQSSQNFYEHMYLILLYFFQIWLSLANKCQWYWGEYRHGKRQHHCTTVNKATNF